jgi:hypothetical protein
MANIGDHDEIVAEASQSPKFYCQSTTFRVQAHDEVLFDARRGAEVILRRGQSYVTPSFISIHL